MFTSLLSINIGDTTRKVESFILKRLGCENLIDKKRFFFLPIIEKEKDSIYITDNNNYAIGKSVVTWIWTRENISKEKINEMLIILEKKFLIKKHNTITCRKEIYDEIRKTGDTYNKKEICYLECNRLKDITLSPGLIDKPNYGDIIILAKWWQDYSKESFQEITLTDSLKEVENWIEDNNFYVWRKNSGKIVCMANYWENEGIAKISYVYTPKEQRNKGYCKSLIHELTKLLLNKRIEPMLYTDYNNISANKAYQSIGYENKEQLISFSIDIA